MAKFSLSKKSPQFWKRCPMIFSFLGLILMLRILFPCQGIAQNRSFPSTIVYKADSLMGLIKSEPDSTHRILLKEFANELVVKSENHDSIRQIIKMLDKEGIMHRNLGNYPMALYFHNLALSLAYRITDISLQSVIYNNIGVVYRRMDNYEPAINNHLIALKLAEVTGNKKGAAISNNSIGNINYVMGRYDIALKYFTRSLIQEQESDNKRGIAININNIGNVYKARGDTMKALEYYYRSLQINTENGDNKGIGICLNDIGLVMLARRNFKEALAKFLESGKLFDQTSDKRFIAENFLNTGKAFYHLEDYQNALNYLRQAYQLALSIQVLSTVQESLEVLAKVYKRLNNPEQAYHHLLQAYTFRDSILNESSRKNIANLQALYETEKMEQEMQYYQTKSELTQLRMKRQRLLFFFSGGTVLIVSVIFFLAYQNKKRSGKLLHEKNLLLDKARDDLRKYAEDLEKSRDQARASDRAKSVFLANMSHEIRTPLNAIIGFSNLIAQKNPSAEIASHIEIIRSSGKSLMILINDILDLSKIEAGKLEIRQQRVFFQKLIPEVMNIFTLQAEQKGLQLTWSGGNGIPDGILSDEARLRQILFNLIGNAVKYTPEGSVSVSLQACESNPDIINGKILQSGICIKVSDTGPGIPEEDHQRIFDAFYQGKYDTKGSESGTGLGLPIARRLTELLGGQLLLESHPGKGSTFTLVFPEAKSIYGQIPAEKTQPFPGVPELRPSIVLIADDVDSNRMLLSGFLASQPVTIINASNGQQAVELAFEKKPDLILMDIRMPVISGFESARRIRENEKSGRIPIIAITASGFDEEVESLRNGPFDDVLLKPILYEEFNTLMRRFLGKES